jgi:membrane-bound metal-dependent hydrolase YbcI (DUF457 family)
MYAITHAVTALPLKRRFPTAPLWPLLISVQAIELLWVLFVYTGIEHVNYTTNSVHLEFLPYSHSIGTTAFVALLVWWWVPRRDSRSIVALALALGVVSHVVLDIIHHEPDIALLPMASGPRVGLGLANRPALDFAVELLYAVCCWVIFRGSNGLLAAIVFLNVVDLPLMFPQPGTGARLAPHPAVLPTIILAQIVMTWLAVWYFAHGKPE